MLTMSRRTTGVQEKIAAAKKEWMDAWMPYLTNDDAPLSPYRVIYEMDQNIDRENAIVTHDAGAPRDQIVPFYTATSPHSYVGWGKSTHLGFSIPLMIGAKMAMPEKFCLNLMGDGAFGMSGTDIETAARKKIELVDRTHDRLRIARGAEQWAVDNVSVVAALLDRGP